MTLSSEDELSSLDHVANSVLLSSVSLGVIRHAVLRFLSVTLSSSPRADSIFPAKLPDGGRFDQVLHAPGI